MDGSARARAPVSDWKSVIDAGARFGPPIQAFSAALRAFAPEVYLSGSSGANGVPSLHQVRRPSSNGLKLVLGGGARPLLRRTS